VCLRNRPHRKIKQGKKRVVLGDNCLSANETGVIHLSKGRNNAELKFASFHNDLTIKPYAIFHGNIYLV
jgi:hypothetical protein